jgi:hypothetical protein
MTLTLEHLSKMVVTGGDLKVNLHKMKEDEAVATAMLLGATFRQNDQDDYGSRGWYTATFEDKYLYSTERLTLHRSAIAFLIIAGVLPKA